MDELFALPLSFGQERLWFLDQLEPGNPAYNIAEAVLLDGPLNPLALEQCLGELARRHEILRTSFAMMNEEAVQVISQRARVDCSLIDVQALDERNRLHAAGRIARDYSAGPFDLNRLPLFRAILVRLCERRHLFVVVMHHIISDGWSMGILVAETARAHDAISNGRQSMLEELPVQYADFAVWQRDFLQGDRLNEQLAYWRERLSPEVPILPVPTDRPRLAAQSFQGATEHAVMEREFTFALTSMCGTHSVTAYVVMLAALNALMHRYTGQEDIVIGTVVTNRDRTELEGLIGFFVNTLVIRLDLSGDPSFRELLRNSKEIVARAFSHQDLPFEMLVRELEPARDLSRSPLFQVLFACDAAPKRKTELSGIRMSSLEIETRTTIFDLVLHISTTSPRISASMSYNTDVLDDVTIKQMLGHYGRLVNSAVMDPDLSISRLPILSDAELAQTLIEWNDYKRKCSLTLLHRLFERQADSRPDAIATICREVFLTYKRLNEKANNVASYLGEMGLGPEERIGVCLRRGEGMVAALIGILKAGCAYTPLDPSYPSERTIFMAQDAKLALVITESGLIDMFAESQIALALMDDLFERERGNDDSSSHPEIDAMNLAYIIYTSGSTGKPKGVAIEHRNVAAFMNWALSVFGAKESASVLASTSICFDLSVFELFLPLSNGGTVVLAENVLELTSLAEGSRISLINTVPSAMAEVILLGRLPSSLDTVNLAGEPLPARLAQEIYDESDVNRIYNLYGPTEDTTYSTYSRVAKNGGQGPCIGRPIYNTETYILDKHFQLLPRVATGGLYLSGAGLARCYMGRPDVTADRFLPSPFGDDPGTRMYWTGDLARYRKAGDIEFLGRCDHQVKVRGFRIELGEVEAALTAHPKVKQAAVGVKDGARQLIAYVTGDVSQRELQDFLRQRLPQYMRPNSFVFLDDLPVNTNGKIDRRALQKLSTSGRGEDVSAEETAGGRTVVEELIMSVWSELLNTDVKGPEDNFFQLGGHSLLATRLMSRTREIFHVEIGIRALFEQPTVAGLAQTIEKAISEGRGIEAPPILPVSRDAELPLSFAQQRLWFFDQVNPDSSIYNLPNALRLEGDLSIPAFEYSLSEITRRHEALRTTFRMLDGQPVQVIAQAEPVKVPMVDLGELREERRKTELARIAKKESLRPFDLARDRLLRVTLLRVGDQEHAALITMHHIITDAWSMGILIKEMATLYETFLSGRPSPLPELPIQYADYSVWQRMWVRGQVLEDHLAYWRQQLGDELPASEIATDRPRPSIQTFTAEAELIAFPLEMLKGLQKLSSAEGVTLYMTMLSALAILLHRYTQQQSIVIGSSIANRNRIETEGLIGLFVNLLVLRSDLSGDPTFSELLRRVRDVCLGMQAYQELPFQKLVEELHPHRHLSRNPLFQMVFVLQNAPSGSIELPNLVLKPVVVDAGTIPFDLILSLGEHADGLFGSLTYNADLFNRLRIKRMLGHYESLLNGILTDPGQRISSLRLMNEEETAGLSASHFTKAKLSQKQFEDLLLAINNTANQG